MVKTRTGFVLVTVLMLTLAGQGNALSCASPPFLHDSSADDPAVPGLPLRGVSKGLAQHYSRTLSEGDKLVLGKFFRNAAAPYLHQKHQAEIIESYRLPNDAYQMPFMIEYTYPKAYRFVGYEVQSGALIPLDSADVGARIGLYPVSEGIADTLPPVETEVIGVLRSLMEGKAFEVDAFVCPTFIALEPEQRADLLACYASKDCE